MSAPAREPLREQAQDQVRLSDEDLALVTELQRPGIKDSTILTLDSVLTLMQLFKAEAALALGALPALLGLSLARAPVYLLTWLSFGIFVACAVYVWFGANVVAGAGAFFALQVALAVLLEWKVRRLHARIDFPESRRGLTVLKTSLKERLKREHAS